MVHSLKLTMLQLMDTEFALKVRHKFVIAFQKWKQLNQLKSHNKVGDWVEVACEYAPGTCSYGGVGFIGAIETNEEGRISCTVSYILDKRIEKWVDPARITVTIMPYTTPPEGGCAPW